MFHRLVKRIEKDKVMFKKICGMGIILGACALLCGCKILDASDKKMEDMEFEVVNVQVLPEEIRDIIEDKKEKAFQMAYHEAEWTYIILGYGIQETSGYSIQVNEVYKGENGVWVDTDLIGPEKSESVETVSTYPYVVIRTDKIEQMIRFKN